MDTSGSWIFVQVPSRKIERKFEVKKSMMDLSSVNSNSLKEGEGANKTTFVECTALEDLVKPTLANLGVTEIFKTQSDSEMVTMFTFCVDADQVEQTLLELNKIGIGQSAKSSVSILPTLIHYEYEPPKAEEVNTNPVDGMDNFYSSIKSRLLVAEVIKRIEAGAQFSFDFLLLLLLAGMICFMGLVENSSVVLVASMLLSPMIGPLLAGMFGAVVRDYQLMLTGIYNEALALFICVALGFVLGLLVCPFYGNHAGDHAGAVNWPTDEMVNRGSVRALWVGVLISVPSGAGVALSVLGGNVGSLVGVAIAASLLPPAVNAGLFWANSLYLGAGVLQTFNQNSENSHDHGAATYFLHGLLSLLVTVLNIICMFASGVFILLLKEVTPEKIPDRFSTFWKKDVRAHINYYKTLNKHTKDDGLQANMGQHVATETGLAGTFIQAIFEKAARDEDFINIKQWVATPVGMMPPKSPNVLGSQRSFGLFSPLPSARKSEMGQSFRMDTFLDVEHFVREEIRNRSFVASSAKRYNPYCTVQDTKPIMYST